MRSYLLILGLVLVCLSSSYTQNETTQYTTQKGDVHLLGRMERTKLAEEEPYANWYKQVYERYTVDEDLITKLDEFYDEDVTIKIYLGTWCGDSKREVTRFLKIVDNSNIDVRNIELIGLDNRPGKTKQGPNREEAGLNIHRVPTFLFYKDGEEIGRIVESPVSSLEMDVAQIYAGLAPRPNYRLANYLLEQFEERKLEDVDTLITQNARYLRHFSKNEGELNTLGYVLMAADKNEEAIISFKLNTLLYPTSGNVFDSLGEAYLRADNRSLATSNYLKSLQLDASNENASKVLQGMLTNEGED